MYTNANNLITKKIIFVPEMKTPLYKLFIRCQNLAHLNFKLFSQVTTRQLLG